jgi:hypothetical protein
MFTLLILILMSMTLVVHCVELRVDVSGAIILMDYCARVHYLNIHRVC